ncbi:MAG: hypothetical protein ACREV1_10115 [Gammaproteobacteria bacterium]
MTTPIEIALVVLLVSIIIEFPMRPQAAGRKQTPGRDAHPIPSRPAPRR